MSQGVKMGNILALAGKKQSGKNTAANVLVAVELMNLGFKARVNQLGQLVVTTDKDEEGVLDLNSQSPPHIKFFAENIWPFIKTYSFADVLKEFCINGLGLTYVQCYGTDEEKNTLTNLKWEDMPGIVTDNPVVPARWKCVATYHTSGYMTGREVMQFFGTDICRKMYGDIWVDATIRKINREEPVLAIITDCRFPNEVIGVQEVGGKVMRLLRNPFEGEDMHLSETALDDYQGFDAVIDNSTMNIAEQSNAIMEYLIKWGWYKNLDDGNN